MGKERRTSLNFLLDSRFSLLVWVAPCANNLLHISPQVSFEISIRSCPCSAGSAGLNSINSSQVPLSKEGKYHIDIPRTTDKCLCGFNWLNSSSRVFKWNGKNPRSPVQKVGFEQAELKIKRMCKTPWRMEVNDWERMRSKMNLIICPANICAAVVVS